MHKALGWSAAKPQADGGEESGRSTPGSTLSRPKVRPLLL
jgi:hypothetical protein